MLTDFNLTMSYLLDASNISGALYHLVATYSVKAGFVSLSLASSWVMDLARPKSAIFKKHSLSSKMFEGCGCRVSEYK